MFSPKKVAQQLVIDLLSPSDELSNQSIVLLHMLQAIGHASSLVICSDHAEPNAGDLVEAGGKERITWCGHYENSEKKIKVRPMMELKKQVRWREAGI